MENLTGRFAYCFDTLSKAGSLPEALLWLVSHHEMCNFKSKGVTPPAGLLAYLWVHVWLGRGVTSGLVDDGNARHKTKR